MPTAQQPELAPKVRASDRFRWRRFLWALGFSLLFHVGFVVPRLLSPLAEMQRRKDDVEVAFLPDPDAPATDPVADPAQAALEKLKAPEKEKVKAEAQPKEKAPQPATLPEPKPKPPEPEKVVEVPPPPPPQPVLDKRKQMVTQDQFEEEQDNADAKYLAEKNHRVTEDTRTESTNLVRRSEGVEKRSAPNENADKEVGEKDQKIAELENHKGTDLPREAPQQGREGQSADPRQQKPGPLAMRNLVPRTDQRAERDQRDGVERQEQAAGELPMQRRGSDGERGGATKKGGKVNLQLDHRAYDNIEGFATAERERREAARAERSHVRGRYDRYLDKVAALKSAIENFTPDVKVGNQAELGTRASPFAGYITAMHRQIHKLWTFSFLADQEMRMGHGPFDDETLWTQLQICLNRDGTLDKVGVIHSSGNTAFDAAAIDTVRTAAPFPKPPQAIRSANGKVYMDWQFHRDERACGTFGVDPHILTTPGEDVQHDTSETGGPSPKRAPGASANAGSGAGSRLGLGGGSEGDSGSRLEEPRRLERSRASASAEAPAATVPDITSEVHTAAEGWFAAWTRGDIAWLAGWSAVPFLANGQVAARTPDALRTMYKQMIAEVSMRKTSSVEVLTPGGVRAKTGGLPPGGEEGGMLFAIAETGGERFVLLLKHSDQGWRVAGLVR